MIDPADPDSAYVIPLVADMDRVTPEGRVRVYETRDAGASWTPRGDGLPPTTRTSRSCARRSAREGSGPRHGPLLRRDVGRRLRLARRGSDLVHGRGEPAAGALGARRVAAHGYSTSSPRLWIRVGVIRTVTRFSPGCREA